MKPLDGELLGILSRMPFLDRVEAAIFSGWSRGAAYDAMSRMEDAGLVTAIPHATVLTPATHRFRLTGRGIDSLAEHEGTTVEDLLRTRPVSAWWRRLLLERPRRLSSHLSPGLHRRRYRMAPGI